MALETSALVSHFLKMALATIIHLHSVPRVFMNSRDAFAPDILTVSGNPVLFVWFHALGITNVTMAFRAFHPGRLDMGHMGEKHARRLF